MLKMCKITFNPVFTELEERIAHANSIPMKDESFEDWSNRLFTEHYSLVTKISYYIYENWEKVKDWSKYRVKLNGIYYSYKIEYIHPKLNKLFKDKSKLINKIKVTYDYVDGDISIECNDDGNWAFLDDEQIIDLGIYIEKELKNDLDL